MSTVSPAAVHVQQPGEDEEDEGTEDRDEDPHGLLPMEICKTQRDGDDVSDIKRYMCAVQWTVHYHQRVTYSRGL